MRSDDNERDCPDLSKVVFGYYPKGSLPAWSLLTQDFPVCRQLVADIIYIALAMFYLGKLDFSGSILTLSC